MPEIFQPASDFAVIAGWIVGAVAIAYGIGLGLSWAVQRLGRRSSVVNDIAQLTRRPVRAKLMVIAASAAVHRVSDPESSWRGWLDHALVLVLIATITWLIASLAAPALHLLHHDAVPELDPQRHRTARHRRTRRRLHGAVRRDARRAGPVAAREPAVGRACRCAAGNGCGRGLRPGTDAGQRTQRGRTVRPAVRRPGGHGGVAARRQPGRAAAPPAGAPERTRRGPARPCVRSERGRGADPDRELARVRYDGG